MDEILGLDTISQTGFWSPPLWRLTVDMGIVVLIWMVQLIVYPSFLYCDRQELIRWHGIYTGRISLLVMPLMLAQVAIVGAQTLSSGFRWDHVVASGLVLGCWISTFSLSVPLHNRISNGEIGQEVLKALVVTNWPRTVGWTVCFLLSLMGLSQI